VAGLQLPVTGIQYPETAETAKRLEWKMSVVSYGLPVANCRCPVTSSSNKKRLLKNGSLWKYSIVVLLHILDNLVAELGAFQEGRSFHQAVEVVGDAL
jgi:hypothetical protein